MWYGRFLAEIMRTLTRYDYVLFPTIDTSYSGKQVEGFAVQEMVVNGKPAWRHSKCGPDRIRQRIGPRANKIKVTAKLVLLERHEQVVSSRVDSKPLATL
jgi:hypothetical protein